MKKRRESVPTKIPLGATELRISTMGVGAWAWGDSFFWGYGQDYGEAQVTDAFKASLDSGINFFDTAEIYGFGRAEQVLNRRIKETDRSTLVITSKFFPYPWRLTRGCLMRALRGSLERLDLKQLDLYLIHWPYPPVSIKTWMKGLVEAVQSELTRAVGVSNYSRDQMMEAYELLKKENIPLACNQVAFNLLHPDADRNGLLDLCREMDITLVAYSPLAQGLLTGKYGPGNPPSRSRRRRFGRYPLERLPRLIDQLREIGQAHGDRTPAQVALNWVMTKGAVPIPGAKNEAQAMENVGAMGWRLEDDEVSALETTVERLAD
jgi:aryl-alcohol dehydrogenase-like predicted oxidoreductase